MLPPQRTCSLAEDMKEVFFKCFNRKGSKLKEQSQTQLRKPIKILLETRQHTGCSKSTGLLYQ
jgi:hypothetical protein